MARILCLAPDLSRNAAYTATQLGGSLGSRHDVTLAGGATGALWAPMERELAAARRLPGTDPGNPAVLRAASALVERNDLVYAFKALPSSLGLALACAGRAGRPVALHLDDWDAGFFADRSWPRRAWYALRSLRDPLGEVSLRRMERRVEQVDALTVSSRRLQERFGGTLVRQGVDTAWFDPARHPRREARERSGLSADAFVALHVGTPAAHKGARVLARLGPALAPSGLVVVVSTGTSAAAGRPGLERRPFVPFRESGWLMAAADVFLLPQEATPYAEHQTPAKLLHAMAMGLPTVATDVGDAAELLGGEPAAGVVVPAGDPDAFEEAVRKLRDDPARRRVMGREARRRAREELGWEAMAGRLVAVLDPLLGGGDRPGGEAAWPGGDPGERRRGPGIEPRDDR